MRAGNRGELLAAAGAELATIRAATPAGPPPLRGKDNIALAAGKVIKQDERRQARHHRCHR